MSAYLDTRTLMTIFGAGCLLFALIAASLQLPERQKALGRIWVVSRLLQGLAIYLLLLRGAISDWISIPAANSVLLLGFMSDFLVAERLLQIKPRRRAVRVIFALFIVTLWAAFVLGAPEKARIVIVAAFSSLVFCTTLFVFATRWRRISVLGRIYGASFAVPVLAGLSRTIGSAMGGGFTLFANVPQQAITFGALLVFLLINGFSFLLLMQEETANALLRSHDSLMRAQRTARMGVIVADRVTGRMAWADSTLRAIRGYETEEWPATFDEFLNTVHPEDRAKFASTAPGEKVSTGSFEFRVFRPDGVMRWISRTAEALPPTNEYPHHLLITNQDITERRHMEEDVRRANEILIFAQRMAHIGSAEIELHGGRAIRTAEYYSILGLAPDTGAEDVDAIVTAFHPDDRDKLRDAMRRMHAGEQVESLELRVLRPDGTIVWVRRDQDFVRGPDGRSEAAVVTLLDITEQKRLEVQKDEFLSTVSHELRTPLTSIRGALAMLAAGSFDQSPDKARRMIDVANRNSERLAQLVDDLLDVQRIQAGRMIYDMADVAISPIVNESIEAIRPFAVRYGVEVKLVNDCPSAMVHGDALRLAQVMANLLSNAIKFSGSGKTVEVHVARKPPWVRITVEDHGQGIPEEFRTRIFQRFAQGDASDSRSRGGSGLGLSIVAAIVAHHKGQVTFETEAGVGTRFHVDLAAVDAASGSRAAE